MTEFGASGCCPHSLASVSEETSIFFQQKIVAGLLDRGAKPILLEQLCQTDLNNIPDATKRTMKLIMDFVISEVHISEENIDFLVLSFIGADQTKKINLKSCLHEYVRCFIKMAVLAAVHVKEEGGGIQTMKLVIASVLNGCSMENFNRLKMAEAKDIEIIAESVAKNAMTVSFQRKELKNISRGPNYASELILNMVGSDDAHFSKGKIDYITEILSCETESLPSERMVNFNHERSFVKTATLAATYVKRLGGNKESMKLAIFSVLDCRKLESYKNLELNKEQIKTIAESVAEKIMLSFYY